MIKRRDDPADHLVAQSVIGSQESRSQWARAQDPSGSRRTVALEHERRFDGIEFDVDESSSGEQFRGGILVGHREGTRTDRAGLGRLLHTEDLHRGVDREPVGLHEIVGPGHRPGLLRLQRVRGVEEGSPAEKAGLEAGDIITRFDGKAIDKPADLPRAVGNTKPGSKVGITVFRRGGHKDLSITVAEVEAEKVAAASPEKKAPAASAQHWGLTVSDLTEAQKREFRVRGGVRVDAVADTAARAGIREGDLIVAIANTEVTSLREFELIMSRVDKNRPTSVLIRRGDGAQYVLIRPVQ